jgi:hypothetical protein
MIASRMVAAGFLARSLDDEGNADLMHVTIDDSGGFHFAGGPEIAPAAAPATRALADIGITRMSQLTGTSCCYLLKPHCLEEKK